MLQTQKIHNRASGRNHSHRKLIENMPVQINLNDPSI